MAETLILPTLDESIVTAAHQELIKADAYKVTSQTEYTSAGEELKRIKGKAFEIENQRVNMKAPALELCRRIDAFFKKPLDFLRSAETAIKRAMVGYSDEQDCIRAEEQRKADEAARKEQEKLAERARKAAESGKVEKAAELEQRAATVVAPIIHREPPKVAGFSIREVPKFEIENEMLIPREYLVPDVTKIRAVVNALKMQANIPGVRVWMAKQPAASAATG